MKIEVCDDCVFVDGKAHALLANNKGASRIRQTLEIGSPIEAAPLPEPPPEPEDAPAEAEPEPLTTENVVQ